MGNGVSSKLMSCCARNLGEISRRHDIAVCYSDPDQLHQGLGHSFCYIRPEPTRLSNYNNNRIHSEETTTFRSISGASVSANTSTPSSTSLTDTSNTYSSSGLDRISSTFESSDSFASIPLQPVPRAPGSGSLLPRSGPIERGFLSGPIERGFLSGPIDPVPYSGPVEKEEVEPKQSSGKQGNETGVVIKYKKPSFMKTLKRVISNKMTRGSKDSAVSGSSFESNGTSDGVGGDGFDDDRFDGEYESEMFSMQSQNLQWAQGKAGEDRVHIVISEEREWVFVGIYDGFNGPDAPDYLLSNLYSNVHEELKGLLWHDKFESSSKTEETGETGEAFGLNTEEFSSLENGAAKRKNGKISRHQRKEGSAKKWKCEIDSRSKDKMDYKSSNPPFNGVNHSGVLRALLQALKKTEEAYFDFADKMAMVNPELALMGSCVLVMLMKGDDIYLMNVGDSRAVLARKDSSSSLGSFKGSQNLGMINEESMSGHDVFDGDNFFGNHSSLSAIQLTMEHSTYVDKEVERIRREHPDDAQAIMNDRVKGYLKVTRAFGVGFLKQPKWNDLLLEMFRIDYIGTSPYITSSPSLYHHKLTPKDRFLILSSDGLYQYFTNQEVVCEVESFIATFPEGDPAQHLIEELLFRAAKKAALDFHELLDIPQGDRRRYHDDVSVIIMSLEGRIWRSSL